MDCWSWSGDSKLASCRGNTPHAPGQPDAVFGRLDQGLLAPGGPEYPGFVSFNCIAHFVEVRVEHSTSRFLL